MPARGKRLSSVRNVLAPMGSHFNATTEDFDSDDNDGAGKDNNDNDDEEEVSDKFLQQIPTNTYNIYIHTLTHTHTPTHNPTG